VVFEEATDEAIVEKAIREDIPGCLDYLEGELTAAGFLFGSIGIADLRQDVGGGVASQGGDAGLSSWGDGPC